MKAKILYSHRALVLAEQATNENESSSDEKVSLKKKISDLRRYLIVGDLHIGFEERFAGSGVQLRSNYEKMLSELIQIIQENKITDLIINGDIKSGVDRILKVRMGVRSRVFRRLFPRSAEFPSSRETTMEGWDIFCRMRLKLLDVNGVHVV